MRILIIYRHYWPDTAPYARILKAIAERLVSDGHEVQVYSAQPSYNDNSRRPAPSTETIRGVGVRRVPLFQERKGWLLARIINTILFLGGAILHAIRSPRYDLVLVNSTPAVFQGAAARLISRLRGAPYIYNCQDLHPEAGLYGDKFDNGWIYRLLRKIDTSNIRDSERTVVLSRDMATTVVGRGLAGDGIDVINNMITDDVKTAGAEVPAHLVKSPDKYRVIFAGNIGAFQGLERIVDAARLLSDRADVEFLFLGSGVAKQSLIERAGDLVKRNVVFHDRLGASETFAILKTADLGIVSLRRNVYRVAYPSKTMSLLSAGCPLLLVAEAESEICRFVLREDVGRICPTGEPSEIARVILDLSEARSDWGSRRERIRSVAERYFGQEHILDRWSELVSGIVCGEKKP